MRHLVLHIVSLKFARNYYFYADALPLTSSRSGTKFATLKLSLIKCQRASTVCFRISNYAQTYIHFICKTKLLIHTSTLAMLRQELFCKKQGRNIRNRLRLPLFIHILLQVKYAVFDLLRPALIPELCSDVATGSSSYKQVVLVTVATVRALPDELAVLVGHDLDLTVVAADLAVVALRI